MILRHRFIVPVIVAGVFGASAAAGPTYGQANFSLAISTPQDVVTAGSEVRVEITMTNISNHDIYTSVAVSTHGAVGENYHGIEIKNDKGVRAPLTRHGHMARGESAPADKPAQSPSGNAPQPAGPNDAPFTGSELTLTIEPGQTSRDAIIANKLYDLSQPGKYSIQVTKWDAESKTTVTSNTITITVVPATP